MPKNIDATVGFGGSNLFKNVVTVQYLLNCVPATRGGPVPELVMDGVAGPKTLAAIRKFQTAALGMADGRVDPNAGTIRALQGFDPHPQQPIGAAAVVKMPSPPAPFVKWSGTANKFAANKFPAVKITAADKFAASKFAPGKLGTGPFGGGKSGPGFPPGTGGKLGG